MEPEPRDADGERTDVCERCGRDATRLRDIPLDGWRDIAWRVRGELAKDNLAVVAGGMAFFALLALVPAFASLASLYGIVADPKDVERHVVDFAAVLPLASQDLMRQMLRDISGQPSRSLGVGAIAAAVVTLWSTSAAMNATVRALNIAYDEDRPRSWVVERAMSLAFTAFAVLMGAIAIGLIVALPVVASMIGLPEGTARLVKLLRWPVLFVVFVGVIAALYRYAPKRRQPRWRWVMLGAVVATALWVLSSILLSAYLRSYARLAETYGPLGAVIALMLWLYVGAWVVLLGAEINAESEHQTRCDTTVGPERDLGERGAYVADHVGPCRPRLRRLIKAKLREAGANLRAKGNDLRAKGKDLRDRTRSRARRGTEA